MSELDPQDGTAPDVDGLQWEDELPVDDVRQLFVTLGKAFRAYQLYDDNNPVRRRFLEGLRSEFQRLWGEMDRIVVTVDEDHLFLEGHEVYRSDSRADSLAFLFFKDGVREITLLPGIEGEELERFLSVLQRARKLVPEGDDLLTVLWEEDLRFLSYRYVDLMTEGVALPEPGSGNTGEEMQAVLVAEDEQDEEAEGDGEADADESAAPQTVKQDDFNPTLYALDPREMETLRAEVRKEMARDTRDDVLSALLDRLEERDDRERQVEILQILSTLLPNFLSRGAIVAATRVLEELRALERREGVLDEHGASALRDLLDGVSEQETLEELIKALYDGTIRATPAQLGHFLSHLRGTALAPLLHATETVDHKELRSVLRAAIQGIANRNRSAVLALLEEEEDAVVAAGAARLVGDLQVTEAGPALARLLTHDAPSVRLAAVEAAISLRASTVAGALEHALDDPDRDVRVAAARALGTLRYGPAAETLGGIVDGKVIRNADIGEKVAVFEAYGTVAGEGAVRVLDKLLNGKGFLGKRAPSEVRAAAALGLGRVGSEDAATALREALEDEDPVVRSNVNRALREEG
ncbi:MAG: HEAT repeat domain-containing protein [Gemmatimonadota bacterium]|nr:HEAT repeat domain-containing protein [Gemmatimonadota bacterium]